MINPEKFSQIVKDFSAPGDSNLGPHHPLNVFRSAYSTERRKVARNLTRIVKLSQSPQQQQDEKCKVFAFKLSNLVDGIKDADIITSSSIYISSAARYKIGSAKLIWSPPLEVAHLHTPVTIQEFNSPADFKIVAAVMPIPTTSTEEDANITTTIIPWFYTQSLIHNKGFRLHKLGQAGASLDHIIEVVKTCASGGDCDNSEDDSLNVEMWIEVVHLSPQEKLSISSPPSPPLAATVTDSSFIPHISSKGIYNETFTFAVAFPYNTKNQRRRVSIVIVADNDDNDVLYTIFENIPIEALLQFSCVRQAMRNDNKEDGEGGISRDGEGWLIFTTCSPPPSPWPPSALTPFITEGDQQHSKRVKVLIDGEECDNIRTVSVGILNFIRGSPVIKF